MRCFVSIPVDAEMNGFMFVKSKSNPNWRWSQCIKRWCQIAESVRIIEKKQTQTVVDHLRV